MNTLIFNLLDRWDGWGKLSNKVLSKAPFMSIFTIPNAILLFICYGCMLAYGFIAYDFYILGDYGSVVGMAVLVLVADVWVLETSSNV